MSAQLPTFWFRARALYARAIAAFGEPQTIAAMATLSRVWRREMGAWLAQIESIVRKLLFVEAAGLGEAPTPKNWSAPLRGGAARADLDASMPQATRATFALALPRDPRVVPEAQAPRIRSFDAAPPAPPPAPVAMQQHKADPMRRLARRFEALRRVLDNPIPHARRLKALLARASRRFPEIVTRFILAAPRAKPRDEYDPQLPGEAAILAYDAQAAPNSS